MSRMRDFDFKHIRILMRIRRTGTIFLNTYIQIFALHTEVTDVAEIFFSSFHMYIVYISASDWAEITNATHTKGIKWLTWNRFMWLSMYRAQLSQWTQVLLLRLCSTIDIPYSIFNEFKFKIFKARSKNMQMRLKMVPDVGKTTHGIRLKWFLKFILINKCFRSPIYSPHHQYLWLQCFKKQRTDQ